MNILVSGAGIAGLASARELGRQGHDVTVVESGRDLRLAGTPIDIRGSAIQAAADMGLLPTILKRRIRMSEFTQFVDSAGEPVAWLPMAEMGDSDDDIEILREDLMRILADDLPATATIRFEDCIESLTDTTDGVDVRFRSGRTGRYDLVLGADGQHSAVRRMVFGPDGEHLRHLGVYAALADIPDDEDSDGPNRLHNVPGRMAGIFRYQGKTVAVFQFLSEPIEYDYRDLAAQKRILADVFSGCVSWRIPELLDAALADPGFYFTAASQIRLPSWHRGRVVLVGDAGYCPAFLSGRGTSLALKGACVLAEELARSEGDHRVAFSAYDRRLRPDVTYAQNTVESGRARILPDTWDAIAARDAELRARVNTA